VGPSATTAPFTRRVIIGSNNSVSAPSPQSLGGQDYVFSSWSDGGAAAHNIVAPVAPTTYQPVFQPVATPTLAVAGSSVVEGSTGTTNLAFTVTLSPATGQTVTVDYASGGGTATAGTDYAPVNVTLTFAPGMTSQTVLVLVNGDGIDEVDETVSLTISAATNAVIGTAVAQGLIVDDDGVPAITISDAAVTEGNTGTIDAIFVVSMSVTSALTVEVDYVSVGGSAVSGQDFLPVTGTLTLTPGATSGIIRVAVVGDTLREPNENFRVQITAVRNASLLDASGQGKINDNDKGKQ
jgi:Calx-beta domain